MIATLLIVAGVVTVAGSWFLFDARTRGMFAGPEPVQAELNAMAQRVGTHVLLPVGEEPTIATVTDLAPLAGQKFFEQASIGDVVLIFQNAKIAVLYDPRRDLVINMAPLADENMPIIPGGIDSVLGVTSSPARP